MNQVFAQPVGVGQDVKRPPVMPPLAYLVGIALGAVTTAVAVAVVGSLLGREPWSRLLLLAAAATAIAMGVRGEVRGEMAPLPERRRQVPVRWLMWRRSWLTAAAFGYLLGMGVWTLLHHASAYVVLGCLLLVAPGGAAAAGLAYGLTRGGLLLCAWATAARNARFHRRLTFLNAPVVDRFLPW